MATAIQGYRPRVDVTGGGLGPSASASAAPVFDYGKPIAQIAGDVESYGKNVAEYHQLVARQQHYEAVQYANTTAADARVDAQGLFAKHQDEAAPDGKDFTPNFLGDLDKSFQQRLAAAPDDRSRALLKTELTRIKASIAPDALRFEHGTRRAYQLDQLGQSTDASVASVYADPRQQDEAIRNQVAAIATTPLSDNDKRDATLKAQNSITHAAWLRRANDNPETTLTQLKAGPPEGMAAHDYINLTARTQELVTQQEKEREREAKLAAAQAKAEAAQKMAENRATLADKMQDEVALRADGQGVKTPLTKTDFAAAYDPKQVDMAYGRYLDHKNKADALGLVKGASIEDQDKLLAENRPDPGKPGYADQAAGYQAMQQAVSEDRRRLLEDPAADSIRSSPAVQQAWASAGSDPAGIGKAVTLSLQEQQRRGVPENDIAPLPKQAVSDVVDKWKQAGSAEDRIAALLPYTAGLRDDGLASKAVKQLEEAGLSSGAKYALDAWAAGDQSRARELMGVLAVKPGDAAKLHDPQKSKAVDAALSTLAAEPNLHAAALQAAAITAQPGANRTAAQADEMVRQVAVHYAQTEEPAAAVHHAYKTVYGNGATTTDASVGIVPLPAGRKQEDASAFQAGLSLTRQNVDLSHLAPTRDAVKAMLPPGTPEGTIESAFNLAQRDHAAWEGDVRSGAKWVAAPGGYQLVLPSGQAVTRQDGKARVWSADEIEHNAMTGGQPLVPTAEGEPATSGTSGPSSEQLGATGYGEGPPPSGDYADPRQWTPSGRHAGHAVLPTMAKPGPVRRLQTQEEALTAPEGDEWADAPGGGDKARALKALARNKPDEGGMGGSR